MYETPTIPVAAGHNFERQLRDMNEALLISSIREHELLEQARTADSALRESEQRQRLLLDSMPQKIFTAQPNGEVDYFNPQWTEFTGLSFEQIKGWGWQQFIHPDDLDDTVRLWTHSVATGETYRHEHRFRRADGEQRWHFSHAIALRDSDGGIVKWVGSNSDIHDQRQTANQLQESAAALADLHRRKDEFLAMLSHELRNPLAAISNAVYLLRLETNDEILHQEARTIIERQVGQLKHLVDDLLEISRISTGKIRLRQERLTLSGIVEHAVETAQPLLKRRRHELTLSLPPRPIWLYADPARLEQVVVNLLNNAAKYTEEGGRIWLSVENSPRDPHDDDTVPNTAIVRVRDTGVGIAPDLLPHIFDLFTQAERSLDRSQGGLGIGLSLVQRLVELHGGTVSVSSALGQGSEFVVRLPVIQPPEPQLPTRAEINQPVGQALRVLVVDDNVDATESLAMLLRHSGYDVRTAYEGPTALEAVLVYRPDAVLLDIGLPGLDGYEVAMLIRQQPLGNDIVLIAMTGYGQESDRRRSHDSGFNHHLVKPTDFAKVQQVLATIAPKR